MDKKLRSDLKTLARFIEVYCRHQHTDKSKTPAKIKGYDLRAIAGKVPHLCPTCLKLITHAYVKRSLCPLEPKPACKRCPDHCYHPQYRRQIREVMKYSGRKLVLSGRLDYLFHLLFK
ncbi:MAG: nitrous oxide-stimulated promoter family protein [Planctomycetota bacterium]|jgi:hypothetical protein